MAKIGSGKSAVWVAVILFSLLLTVIAQPGFLSIDCGSKTNHNDENNIAWVPDANYIDVGQTTNTGNTELPSYLQSLRFFPKPLDKACYQLPVEPQVPYLLRLWFVVGNYTGIPQLPISFAFSVETLGLLTVRNLKISRTNRMPAERIVVSAGTVLYICLIRTSEIDHPFINAIELRTLRNGMYSQAKPGRMLRMQSRYYAGGSSSVRYPQDNFDRIWTSGTDLTIIAGSDMQTVSLPGPISTNSTQDLPPAIVMQKGWETISETITLNFNGGEGTNSLMLLYFADIGELNMTERSFQVFINGQPELAEPITIAQNYSSSEVQLQLNVTNYRLTLVKAPNSMHGPILNAFENYVFVDTDMATYREDVEVLEGIKTRFNIKSWISDPCYLILWDGIGCDKSSSVIRISEINLSGMNLTGSIPQSIRQLTAVVNVSLDNNQLIGPLPNFSDLTMLERLHLQNNNLTGSLPEWLSELKNLKELFIENNKFTGIIPVQLLENPLLKLRYSGNHDLCIRLHSRKYKVGVALGTAISGAVIMVLVFMVCIVVRRKKIRGRKCLNKDYSMTMPPTPSTSSAFSLKEMTKATENFSRKIGQGGFGSVFFGKLPGGKEIAVKVLSLFSKQGIREFQNEVDLLSRVHHKNLVSLLGYCNESKELMLIYEHMSRGSLRDHLYGSKAGISELNWKTRLKIALDAAQGLEYLHVGCTPKIIHRDVKTANILLDSNLKGKLADFGLSRIATDEEATHVTTMVKGTAGYLDPEYFRTQMLTERSDVYSFGVVLLEVICGRAPINPNLPEEEVNLIQWVKPYVENESAEEIAKVIDGRLGGNYDMKSITGIAKVALRCVEAKPSSRPSVSEVVADIKEAIIHENENNAPLPNPEVIGIECGDLQCMPGCLQVDAMKWEDNSSNLPNVGR